MVDNCITAAFRGNFLNKEPLLQNGQKQRKNNSDIQLKKEKKQQLFQDILFAEGTCGELYDPKIKQQQVSGMPYCSFTFYNNSVRLNICSTQIDIKYPSYIFTINKKNAYIVRTTNNSYYENFESIIKKNNSSGYFKAIKRKITNNNIVSYDLIPISTGCESEDNTFLVYISLNKTQKTLKDRINKKLNLDIKQTYITNARKLTDKITQKYSDIITGTYIKDKTNNDHMVSLSTCFELGITLDLACSPANLMHISKDINKNKHTRCSITLKELINRHNILYNTGQLPHSRIYVYREQDINMFGELHECVTMFKHPDIMENLT